MLPLLIRFFVLALIVWVAWRMIRPNYTVRIVIDPRGVRYYEGLPKAHAGNVLSFLKDISPGGPLVIRALREANGRLRIDFKGDVDPGTRQLVRNLLNTVM